MRMSCLLGCFVVLGCFRAAPQSWVAQQSHTSASLRGISAVNAKVAWASGTHGTYVRTVDGGEHWEAAVVPGAEQLDFRDVEAFDADTAILLASGPGEKSRIYSTADGGRNWKLVARPSNAKSFWDCLAFYDRRHGFLLGDPVDGKFELMATYDGGDHWEQPALTGPLGEKLLSPLPGEGAFAASGTCIAAKGPYLSGDVVTPRIWFGTGGAATARIFSGELQFAPHPAPLAAGAPSAGVFSIAFTSAPLRSDKDHLEGIAVGGDYARPGVAENNVALSHDSGETWQPIPGPQPHGYRSAVAYVRGHREVVAVGTNGSDYSRDGGNSWRALDNENYNSVSFAGGGAGWAVGPNGRIAKWTRRSR
ncbi:MAG: hypothetical protein JO041_15590 [Acidobacteria bacterium]|nr:hypothetical protein [Acidobacteriota bacterium]